MGETSRPIRADWPTSVRLGAAATSVVALGSAIQSWDALSWAGAQVGVDARLAPLFPVVIDGVIAMGTITALALRSAPWRVRAYVWVLLAGAVSASVVGNAAHAAGGSPLHEVGAALPAVALAASLHLLVLLVRHVGPVRAEVGPDMSDGEDIEDTSLNRQETRPDQPSARVRLRALMRRHGADLDADTAAARLGVSKRHAARLLAEARRPTVAHGQLGRVGAE